MRLPGLITRNFKLKVGCALLAVVAWAGVVYASNPPQQRVVSVPVPQQAAAVPAGYQLVRSIPPLQLHIGGVRSNLDAFSVSMLTVTVDWAAVKHPGVQQIPVSIGNSDSLVQLIDPPASITAEVDSIGSVTVPVTIRFAGLPPAGFVISSQAASPSTVLLVGPAHELTGLQAVVTVDLANRRTNYDADLQPYVYDVHGNQVNVNVSPAHIHVTVTVSSAQATRAVVVVPRLAGTVAAGYQLAAEVTSPLTVVLSGPEDLLNGLDSIETQTIALDGMFGSVTRVVSLALPAGVSATPATVTVTLTAEPLPGPTGAPLPTPTPSPSPT
jgi:YbbR domain-containing protein